MSDNFPDQALQRWWMQHRLRLLQVIAALMAAAAVLKLGDEFRRLVWETGPNGAIDMKYLHGFVAGWFSGQPVYEQYHAPHPPATFVMLWPLLGWLSVTPARWYWAATSVVALPAIILLILRISRAETRLEQIFVALLLLSINGTGVTIGNGQLILHILPALLAGVLVLNRERNALGDDLIAAALLTWTLLKPSVAAPFLWVFLFGWQRWRPVLVIVVMYAVLTLVATAFQKESLPTLFEMFLKSASATVSRFPGTRNVHALLADVGLEKWIPLSSGIIFAALGVWTFCYRRADRWVLMAVAALIARMWTYHRVYDDVLILLPELALFRIAKENSWSRQSALAGVLLAVTALAMLCPARFLDQPSDWAWTSNWAWIFTGGHTILWLLVLAYLMNYARHDRDGSIRMAAR